MIINSLNITVSQTGSLNKRTATIKYKFVADITQFEPVINLYLYPTDKINFPRNTNIFYRLNFGGVTSGCSVNPIFPLGIEATLDSVSGKTLFPSTYSLVEYSVQCFNSYSKSNTIKFKAAIVDEPTPNFLMAQYWVSTLSGQLDCDVKYDPPFTPNTKIAMQRLEGTIHHPYTEDGRWAGLGSKFNDYWGVVYSGFIKIPFPGMYTFTAKSEHGIWMEVNGREVIFGPGCRKFNDRVGTIDISLDAEYYEMRLLYFHNGGPSGLELYYSRQGEPEDKISLGQFSYCKFM